MSEALLLLLLGRGLGPRGDILGLLGLLLLLLLGRTLLTVLLLGIPLAGLEDQDADEDERQDGVAGREHAEAVLPAEDDLAVDAALARLLPLLGVPDLGADGAQALDGVGGVDGDDDEVEDHGGAVEEEVGLAGAPHLDDEAAKDGGQDNVEDARDEGRRLVHEAQVRFQLVKEPGGYGLPAPEEGEVVGEHRKEDTEEEARR